MDVFRNTTAEVRKLSGGKQEPRISEMSITERLYLAGGQGTQVASVGLVFRDCQEAYCPEMVVIPGGSFKMGSDDGDADEKPPHSVSVRQFAMGKYEVTQGQWRAVMGNNPSEFRNCGDNCPVEQVSWEDIQQFLKKLNQKTGKQYRLPSEAEWEYAARAGTTTKYWWGDKASHE